MPVQYEWDVETFEITDGEVEIVDHDHSEKLLISQYMKASKAGNRKSLVLVRDVVSDNGVEDREWAYVQDGKLPTHFQDAYGKHGTKVPKSKHLELQRVKGQLAKREQAF